MIIENNYAEAGLIIMLLYSANTEEQTMQNHFSCRHEGEAVIHVVL